MNRVGWVYKYDLCENEIQCDGRTIAYSDNSIFDIKDKAEFNKAVQEMAMKLGYLIERANKAAVFKQALEQIAAPDPHSPGWRQSRAKEALATEVS